MIDVFVKLHNGTKTKIFFAYFCFLKEFKIFLLLLGNMHVAQPLPKSPLICS